MIMKKTKKTPKSSEFNKSICLELTAYAKGIESAIKVGPNDRENRIITPGQNSKLFGKVIFSLIAF